MKYLRNASQSLPHEPVTSPPCVYLGGVFVCGVCLCVGMRMCTCVEAKEKVRDLLYLLPTLFRFWEGGLTLNVKLVLSARLAGQQFPRIYLSLPPNTGIPSTGGHAWLLSPLLIQGHLSSFASMTANPLLFLAFLFQSLIYRRFQIFPEHLWCAWDDDSEHCAPSTSHGFLLLAGKNFSSCLSLGMSLHDAILSGHPGNERAHLCGYNVTLLGCVCVKILFIITVRVMYAWVQDTCHSTRVDIRRLLGVSALLLSGNSRDATWTQVIKLGSNHSNLVIPLTSPHAHVFLTNALGQREG